jgi:hypothetical protein
MQKLSTKNMCISIEFVPKAHNLWKLSEVSLSKMFTNVVLFTTTLIAELVRALISSTILMINSFYKKAIVWMCLFPTSVGGIPRDPASSVLVVVAALVSVFLIIEHSSNHFVHGSSSCSFFF